jgi:hypothetical protein
MASTDWTDKAVADAPLFYCRYLFFDVRHTWLLAYLALAAGYLFARGDLVATNERHFGVYAAIWLLGLLGIFSFIPVSFVPLRFVMKQSNYMTIFLAPLAIVGAFGLSRMGRWMRAGLMTAFVAGGIALAALAQQDMRAFMARGQAAEAFAEAHARMSCTARDGFCVFRRFTHVCAR